MNILDYWMIKLAEECCEVGHRCAKIQQYGPEEVQDGHTASNEERLKAEVLDLLSIITLMQRADALPYLTPKEILHAEVAKQAKLRKYFHLSHSLGRVNSGGKVAPP